ncbi:MAG: nuclear transport factor 2 family protein [Acidobacteria bacterium]|nr:nuclear transport factor 2 family protein [Acidobacteriota bacterium]
MTRILLGTALILLAPVLAAQNAQPAAKAAPPPVTQTDAVDREKQLFAADQKHDLDKVSSIVADEFVDIGRDGGIIGKQALLKEIPNITLVSFSQSNWDFDSMGPFAYAISYDSDAVVLQQGKQAHSQNHLNSVWIYRDGRWQMLLHSRGGQKEEAR